MSKPRDWAPVVYCWRGGKRSASLAHVLNEIGWRAVQLDGGYRTWRRHVVEALTRVPARFRYVVVCGLTGSGKSRLLAALRDEGAQVLDLEQLARHRGSLLGDLPGDPQPSQKAFDTDLLGALERLRSGAPRLRRVGEPEDRHRAGPRRAARRDARGDVRARGHAAAICAWRCSRTSITHFIADPASLADKLEPLVPVHGRKVIERWVAAAAAGDFATLIDELLATHYDPTYGRSILRNFPRHADAIAVTPHAIAHAGVPRAGARSRCAGQAPRVAVPA